MREGGDEEVVEEDEFAGLGPFATDFDKGAISFECDEDLEGGSERGREEW